MEYRHIAAKYTHFHVFDTEEEAKAFCVRHPSFRVEKVPVFKGEYTLEGFKELHR